MGEKVTTTKRNFAAIIPMLFVTTWSMNVFIQSIGRENWRMVCSGLGFVGLATMTYFFYRKIKQRTKVSE
jgi:hypothetical protein